MAEAATGTAWTPCHTHYPIKPGWSLATAPLAAAQGGWYGRQDQKGETPKASEDTEHRIPGGSLPAVKSDWERTGKDRRTARTSPAAL